MIIGMKGVAQSGKDTVAEYLIEKYGFQRLAFADKLKEAVYELNPIVYDDVRVQAIIDAIGWDEAKTVYGEIRELLQRMGTEVGRKLFKDSFWVDLVWDQIKSGHYVITDVRFQNEADSIQNQSGLIVHINRPGYGPVNNHISDTGVDAIPADAYILNDGTIEDLHRRVDFIIRNIDPSVRGLK